MAVSHFGGIPINISENFGPLFGLLVNGTPIVQLGPRQYGVVAFLLVDPIVRLYGTAELPLNAWALFLCLIGIGVAFMVVMRRYFRGRGRVALLLGVVWMGFNPIIDATATRLFDLIVLGMLSTTLYFYTGDRRARTWSGVGAAAGFLTKLLPLLFLPFVAVRDRLALACGLATSVVLLAVGQILYGPLMGFGYPLFLLTSVPGTTTHFSYQGENNSIRGLIFKVAAGFRTAPGGQVAETEAAGMLNVIAFAVEFALIAYLFVVLWRARRHDGLERRSIEFALAVVTMYLVAPHTAHEHMVSMILVFTIIGWVWATVPARRSALLGGLSIVSLALIGVYVPYSVLGAIVPLEPLMRIAGNESSEFFGSPIASYNFLAFPGVGLISAWGAVALLERRSR